MVVREKVASHARTAVDAEYLIRARWRSRSPSDHSDRRPWSGANERSWPGGSSTLRLQPRSEVPTLECVLVDESGATITLVFLGRRSIAGVRSGAHLAADGMVGKHEGKLAMINPIYELLVGRLDPQKARARNGRREGRRQ